MASSSASDKPRPATFSTSQTPAVASMCRALSSMKSASSGSQPRSAIKAATSRPLHNARERSASESWPKTLSASKKSARPTARRCGKMQLSRRPIETMNSSAPASSSVLKSEANRAIRWRPPKFDTTSSAVMLAKMSGRSATA